MRESKEGQDVGTEVLICETIGSAKCHIRTVRLILMARRYVTQSSTHGEGKPLLDAQFMLTPPCKRTLSRSRDLYSTVSGPRWLVRDRFMANMLPAI